MGNNITREITPLTQNDCFAMFIKEKDSVNHPVHYHDEYELNLILNAKGARRIVGNHIDTIDDHELILIGPGQHHGWYTQKDDGGKVTEITIQFHKDLFDNGLLNKHPLTNLKIMLENASRGMSFSQKTAEKLKPVILLLKEKSGFDSVLHLMLILHELSICRDAKILSSEIAGYKTWDEDDEQLNKVLDFMEINFSKPITTAEATRVTGIIENELNRLIKTSAGISFTDALDEIRISNASKMLIETTHTIAEIAYKCGFNNLSHFNRLFKRKMQYQPREFRLKYTGITALYDHN